MLVCLMPGELPDVRVCEQARLSRDPRFDGVFFTAVTSTGIYCRPVCPAPAPRPRNVRYFASAAAAEGAGFRPCLRCRPELAPGDAAWRRGDDVVARALALIDQGVLTDAPLSTLASRLNVGERHLRRLFVQRVGAPPVGVHGTRRLLLAKQLLTDTTLPIIEIALASGFNSLRRFNTTFREAYRLAPRDLRRLTPMQATSGLVLRLGYRPPYDFGSMLAFLGDRAIPGVECVDKRGYSRLFSTPDGLGWLRVSAWTERNGRAAHALRLEIFGSRPAKLLPLVAHVRRMFDLDADPRAIGDVLRRDQRLHPLVTQQPGLRLPGGWDGFEVAVRAVVGQQVSVAAARTITTRLVQRLGAGVSGEMAPLGFSQLFPTPAVLAEADLTGLGLTRDRANTLRQVARAVIDGRVDFRRERSLDDFVARWTALPGIGPWTAHYLALRALSHPDALPSEDLVLRKALSPQSDLSRSSPVTAAAVRSHAEQWRPWRAYAVLHLWTATAAHSRGTTTGQWTTP